MREVLDVAGDYGESVALSGGYDQTVHDRQGGAGEFGLARLDGVCEDPIKRGCDPVVPLRMTAATIMRQNADRVKSELGSKYQLG